jgi:hypothetical protein
MPCPGGRPQVQTGIGRLHLAAYVATSRQPQKSRKPLLATFILLRQSDDAVDNAQSITSQSRSRLVHIFCCCITFLSRPFCTRCYTPWRLRAIWSICSFLASLPAIFRCIAMALDEAVELDLKSNLPILKSILPAWVSRFGCIQYRCIIRHCIVYTVRLF